MAIKAINGKSSCLISESEIDRLLSFLESKSNSDSIINESEKDYISNSLRYSSDGHARNGQFLMKYRW